MARSRNIKPGFFCNEDMVELDFATRLLFAGLWTVADREGRLEDRPKKIKINVFPADDVDVESMLVQLAAKNFIIRYEVNGTKYVQVTNWHKHQRPHNTEKHSVIPDVNGEITVKEPLEPSDSPSEHRGNPPDSLIPDSLNTDSLIPDSSVPKGTAAKAALSTSEIIFSYGIPLLVNAGSTDKQARSFFGGLRKQHGDDAVVDALRECIRAKPLQPLDWLAAALPPKGKSKQPESFKERDSRKARERWEEMTGESHPDSNVLNVIDIPVKRIEVING
jgi:hypothetical protein